jgi:hypothetical protein
MVSISEISFSLCPSVGRIYVTFKKGSEEVHCIYKLLGVSFAPYRNEIYIHLVEKEFSFSCMANQMVINTETGKITVSSVYTGSEASGYFSKELIDRVASVLSSFKLITLKSKKRREKYE